MSKNRGFTIIEILIVISIIVGLIATVAYIVPEMQKRNRQHAETPQNQLFNSMKAIDKYPGNVVIYDLSVHAMLFEFVPKNEDWDGCDEIGVLSNLERAIEHWGTTNGDSKVVTSVQPLPSSRHGASPAWIYRYRVCWQERQ